MTLLLVNAAPWPGGYSSHVIREPWAPGERRTVPEGVANYLLATFPGVFVEALPAEPAEPTDEVVSEPPPAAEPPKRRRG